MYLAFLHGQRRGGATGGSVDDDGAGTGIPGGVRRRSEEGERESRDEPRLATQRACVRDPGKPRERGKPPRGYTNWPV